MLIKKIISVLMIAILCLPIAACRKDDGVDHTKTQFYIGNYDGGVGRKWIETIGKRFEQEYADVSFERGKNGIQIWYTHNKDEYKPGTLLTTIQNNRQDVYLLDAINYHDFVSQGRLMDISDVVRGKAADDEEMTIEMKMNKSRREYFKYSDNSYYALPFFDHVMGIVYDVDLFEEERLYNNGLGPDGVVSYDDGLPRTYEEFKQLMSTMTQKGITPFTWTGRDSGYRIDLLNEIWVKYEGAYNYGLNHTFSGQYQFEGDSAPTPITMQNGYLLQGQKGKRVALQFAKDILGNDANYSRAGFYSSQAHTEAQEEYLLSVRRPNGSNQIAMLIEGSWWENEAKPVFSDMELYGKKYGYGERRFALMPLPNFAGGSQDNTLYMGRGNSAIVIKAGTPKPELSKLFLKYLHTNESLAYFNEETGVTRPYNYEMSQDQLNNLTHFGRSLRMITNDENVVKVYNEQQKSVGQTEAAFFSRWAWGATIGDAIYDDPFLAFYNEKNLTVDTYMNGLATTYSQTKWNEALKKYWE